MAEILIPIAFFAMIVMIVRNNRLKKERTAMIQMGINPEEHNVPKSGEQYYLKWGVFLITIGFAIIVGRVLVYFGLEEGVAYFSTILIFGGVTLILINILDVIGSKNKEKTLDEKDPE